MSHFAELDSNNVVLRVLVCDNNDPNGDEGYSWLVNNLGGRWIQTSYSSSFRKNFAGIGYIYNEELDAFIAPQPFPSWTLNTESCQWEAPIPYPGDSEAHYVWDEEAGNWVLAQLTI